MRILLAALLLSPCLMAGSCDDGSIPSIAQVEMNIPDSLRHCPAWPASPGAAASKSQTARYIIAGYYAYKVCAGNNDAINGLYTTYRTRLEAAAKG